ncbi:hypothetical protein MAALD49_18100 [Marinobacter shengliensis]|nr:hypothetical protein MAALD49_18100 [Marinobacter shengliensis]
MDRHQSHHEPQRADYHGRLGEGARRLFLIRYSQTYEVLKDFTHSGYTSGFSLLKFLYLPDI